MMVALVVVGALVAAVGAALAAPAEARTGWRAVAGIAALVVAIGILRQAPEGTSPGTVVLAGEAAGEPAVARVVVVPPGERRQTYAVPLVRPVPAAPAALWTMVAMALVALAGAGRLGRLGPLLPTGAAAAAAAIFWSAAGHASGEAPVRAYLAEALAGVQIDQFTVPTGGWSFPAGGLALACGAAALVALVPAAHGFTKRFEGLARLVPVGAVVALGGVGALLLGTGGPWWTATESFALAATLTVAGAAFAGERPAWQAALLSAGVGLAGLAALGAA